MEIARINRDIVSIHAPTRGATEEAGEISTSEMFQSTLPHGERQTRLSVDESVPLFQSTLPHGERLAEAEIKQMVYSFNPRSHTGSDPFRIAVSSILGVSIHAPTRGATPCSAILRQTSPCFNPRSHTGSDSYIHRWRDHGGVSIHAPTRGATMQMDTLQGADWFQSTLPHGERHTQET